MNITRFMRRFLLLSGIVLLWVTSVRAQQVQNFVHIDSLRVGDTFNYIITAHENKSYDNILFPDSTDFGSDFVIQDKKRYKKGPYADSLVYKLQFFGLKDTLIAPVQVKFVSGNDTITRKLLPVPVYFKSEVKDTTNARFKPLKPIYEFSRGLWPYIIGLIILLIIGYLAYRYYQKKKMEPKPEPEPEPEPEIFINPLEELEESLIKLRDDSDLQSRMFKPFYSRLGDTLRQYYERVNQIPALEMTSGELIRALRSDSLDREMMEYTRKVLNQADMVKFAKFTPTLDQAYEDLETATLFLERARHVDGPEIKKRKEAFEQRKREKRQRELAEKEKEKREAEGKDEAIPDESTKDENEDTTRSEEPSR